MSPFVRCPKCDRRFRCPPSAKRAKTAGLDVEAVSVPGDHLSMVEPAMKQAIAFFQQK